MGVKSEMTRGGGLRAAISGAAAALLLMLVLSGLTSLVVHFSSLSEGVLKGAGIAIEAISLFMGGLTAGRISGERGLINGLIVALIMLILMVLLGGGIGDDFPVKTACCLFPALLGGVFGVR